jgi:hypothetical protein
VKLAVLVPRRGLGREGHRCVEKGSSQEGGGIRAALPQGLLAELSMGFLDSVSTPVAQLDHGRVVSTTESFDESGVIGGEKREQKEDGGH